MKLCIIHIHKRSDIAKTSEGVFSMSLLNPLMGILSTLVLVGEEVIVRARDIFQISGDLLYPKQRSRAGSSTEEAVLVSFSDRHQRNILMPCLKRQKNVEHFHLDYNFNCFQSSSMLEEFSKYFPSTSVVSESSELS